MFLKKSLLSSIAIVFTLTSAVASGEEEYIHKKFRSRLVTVDEEAPANTNIPMDLNKEEDIEVGRNIDGTNFTNPSDLDPTRLHWNQPSQDFIKVIEENFFDEDFHAFIKSGKLLPKSDYPVCMALTSNWFKHKISTSIGNEQSRWILLRAKFYNDRRIAVETDELTGLLAQLCSIHNPVQILNKDAAKLHQRQIELSCLYYAKLVLKYQPQEQVLKNMQLLSTCWSILQSYKGKSKTVNLYMAQLILDHECYPDGHNKDEAYKLAKDLLFDTSTQSTPSKGHDSRAPGNNRRNNSNMLPKLETMANRSMVREKERLLKKALLETRPRLESVDEDIDDDVILYDEEDPKKPSKNDTNSLVLDYSSDDDDNDDVESEPIRLEAKKPAKGEDSTRKRNRFNSEKKDQIHQVAKERSAAIKEKRKPKSQREIATELGISNGRLHEFLHQYGYDETTNRLAEDTKRIDIVRQYIRGHFTKDEMFKKLGCNSKNQARNVYKRILDSNPDIAVESDNKSRKTGDE